MKTDYRFFAPFSEKDYCEDRIGPINLKKFKTLMKSYATDDIELTIGIIYMHYGCLNPMGGGAWGQLQIPILCVTWKGTRYTCFLMDWKKRKVEVRKEDWPDEMDIYSDVYV